MEVLFNSKQFNINHIFDLFQKAKLSYQILTVFKKLYDHGPKTLLKYLTKEKARIVNISRFEMVFKVIL